MKLKTATPASVTRSFFIFLAVSLLAVAAAHAQTIPTDLFGGTGNWTDTSTWSGGVVPTNSNSWQITAPDVVNANSGVNYNNAANFSTILGTLNVNTGASFTVNSLDSSQAPAAAVLNINGGAFAVDYTSANNHAMNLSGGLLTINVTNGGSFSYTGAGLSDTAFNISGSGSVLSLISNPANPGGASLGGTAGTAVTGQGVTTLGTGGTIIFNPGAGGLNLGAAGSTWSGGTVVTNSNLVGSSSSNIFSGLSQTAANILQLSNQTTKQTLNINSNQNNFTLTQGNFQFNIYGATTNSSDEITENGTGASVNNTVILGANVHLQLALNSSASAPAASYVGQSYQLYLLNPAETTASYSTFNPTVSDSTWNIGGLNYDVNFTDDLNSDGEIVINSLTLLVPEPSTLGLVGLGFGLLLIQQGLFRRRGAFSKR